MLSNISKLLDRAIATSISVYLSSFKNLYWSFPNVCGHPTLCDDWEVASVKYWGGQPTTLAVQSGTNRITNIPCLHCSAWWLWHSRRRSKQTAHKAGLPGFLLPAFLEASFSELVARVCLTREEAMLVSFLPWHEITARMTRFPFPFLSPSPSALSLSLSRQEH